MKTDRNWATLLELFEYVIASWFVKVAVVLIDTYISVLALAQMV